MKRFIFSAIALIIAATGCTEGGLIDTPQFYGRAIVFDTYIGKAPVTKAEIANYASLKEDGVHITAFSQDQNTSSINYVEPYMDLDLAYDKTENGIDYWTYGETIFWPEGENLAFSAYALNADVEVNSQNLIVWDKDSNVAEGQSYTKFTYNVPDQVSNQIDLLAANFQIVQEPNNKDAEITLTFYHLLSRIGFSVYSTNTSSPIDIAIHSIRLCGVFPKKGHVDLTSATANIKPYNEPDSEYAYFYELFDPAKCFVVSNENCGPAIANKADIYTNYKFNSAKSTWSERYEQITYTGTDAQKTEALASARGNRYMMIMPGEYDDVYLEVHYQLTGSEALYAKVDLDKFTFNAGKAYEFVFQIATAAIEFSGVVEGDDWDTPEERPIQ